MPSLHDRLGESSNEINREAWVHFCCLYSFPWYSLQTQFNEVFEEIWLLGTGLSWSSSFQPGHEIWKIFKINVSRGIQRFRCLNVGMTTLTPLADAEYKSKSNQSHKNFSNLLCHSFYITEYTEILKGKWTLLTTTYLKGKWDQNQVHLLDSNISFYFESSQNILFAFKNEKW